MIANTEAMRYNLATRAREVFKEEGEILMEHLPIGGNNSMITRNEFKNEFALLRAEIKEQFATYSENTSKQLLVNMGIQSCITAVIVAVMLAIVKLA